jgi:energy-converting hydrogenase Eha subunit C
MALWVVNPVTKLTRVGLLGRKFAHIIAGECVARPPPIAPLIMSTVQESVANPLLLLVASSDILGQRQMVVLWVVNPVTKLVQVGLLERNFAHIIVGECVARPPPIAPLIMSTVQESVANPLLLLVASSDILGQRQMVVLWVVNPVTKLVQVGLLRRNFVLIIATVLALFLIVRLFTRTVKIQCANRCHVMAVSMATPGLPHRAMTQQ